MGIEWMHDESEPFLRSVYFTFNRRRPRESLRRVGAAFVTSQMFRSPATFPAGHWDRLTQWRQGRIMSVIASASATCRSGP